MFLAIDGRLAGIVAVADPIKESAAATIDALQAAGLRIVMATGDGETTARAVAAELGLDEVHGEVRPQGKAELVQKLKARSEEHTSELQSLMRISYAVFCLKKKKKINDRPYPRTRVKK